MQLPDENSNIRQPIKTLNMGTYLHSTEQPAALTLTSVSQKTNEWELSNKISIHCQHALIIKCG